MTGGHDWGTGKPSLYNRSAEYGLSEPLFEEFGDGIKVTMFRKVSNAFEKYLPLFREAEITDKFINNIEQVYKESIWDILKQLCRYKGVEMLEGHLMDDYVHMLVSIPPKISVSQFMGYLKGKSALMIFDKHANLKYKYGNRHFWAEGYYVSTVGLNEAIIRKYIQEQEKNDIAMDKLRAKEYEDSFKGER